MTRPKVPDDKRQRTAQACETCKRRKQKCNGLNPCSACIKRSSTCTYKSEPAADSDPQQKISSPTKRRLVEISGTTIESLAPDGRQGAVKKPAIRQNSVPTKSITQQPTESNVASLSKPIPPSDSIQHHAPYEYDSQQSTISGPDDEAEVYTQTRMLQAPNGRLIYLGDSATLSCLQILRFIVGESESCDFTDDPSRHKIMENVVDFEMDPEPPVNPQAPVAKVLLNSFFTNTHGLLDLFSRPDFERAVYACIDDPWVAKPGMHNLLYLNFATGLVLATPKPGDDDDPIVSRLQNSRVDVAESYFRAAQRKTDPLTIHERADFESVQVLCLMAVYSLSVSRRNAAVTYLAMAVQSAFTLGLHRGHQTQVIFSRHEQIVRRKVWRSLFVLDRFLAAALGRPTLIVEEDCSSDSLDALEEEPGQVSENDRSMNMAVDIARLIGRILKMVYARRRVSTKLAHEFAMDCQKLQKQLQGDFHWNRATDPSTPVIEATAVLHLNLFYCHAVLLYTRPFFLYILKNHQVHKVPPAKFSQRMQKFSRTCVKIAEHTIVIVQGAFHAGYLPRRNPFVTHFLFAASLVVLGNEFARLHPNPVYLKQISSILSIVEYCAKTDPQALRLTYILETFRDVVAHRHQSQSSDTDGSRAVPIAASPRESNTPRPGHIPSIDTDRYNGLPIPDGPSTGTRVTIESPIGHPSAIPVLQDAPFHLPTGNGASPASSGSHSLRGAEGLSGRRASDVNTPAGEDEVNLETLWQSVQGGGHPDGAPLFHAYPPEPPKTMHSEVGSYGMYATFMHGQGRHT